MSACGWGIVSGAFTVGLILGANIGFLVLGLLTAARDEDSPSCDGEVSQDQRSPFTAEEILRPKAPAAAGSCTIIRLSANVVDPLSGSQN
jgi:hypothetical protein